jgi:hypothetical protein
MSNLLLCTPVTHTLIGYPHSLSCITFLFTASENCIPLNVIFFDFRIAILVHSGKFGNVYDGLC